jgi:ABC-2 type transport system ATP-binding protein
MEKIIEIKSLNFNYKSSSTILSDINLDLFDNEIFVLLGHNGAGKTTLIRLLLDFIRGYNGSISLFGKNSTNPESRARVGYMSEMPVIIDFETAEGFLAYFASLAGISDASAKVAELLELTGLIHHKAKKLSSYSKGMKQRLNLAKALLNDPDLLIMDEPVIGLDPIGQELIEKVVVGRKQSGKSVLINTHSVSFAEKVADRVGFLMGGELKRIIPKDEFNTSGFPVEIGFQLENSGAIDLFKELGEIKSIEEKAFFIRLDELSSYKKFLKTAEERDAVIYKVHYEGASLETHFLEYAAMLKKEDRSK